MAETVKERDMNTIQKACGWKEIYDAVQKAYGKEKADAAVKQAEELYTAYTARYADRKGINKGHVFGAIAIGSIYLPLKDLFGQERTIKLLSEAMRPASIAKHNKIENFPPKMFMRIAGIITNTMFSEKAGFKRRWLVNNGREKRYDLLTCPYVEVLTAMGCPEACAIACIQDDYSFRNMKNGVIFPRRKTLGRGDDCCDFGFITLCEGENPSLLPEGHTQ